MAWKYIVGLLKGQNKRPYSRLNSAGADPTTDAALERAISNRKSSGAAPAFLPNDPHVEKFEAAPFAAEPPGIFEPESPRAPAIPVIESALPPEEDFQPAFIPAPIPAPAGIVEPPPPSAWERSSVSAPVAAPRSEQEELVDQWAARRRGTSSAAHPIRQGPLETPAPPPTLFARAVRGPLPATEPARYGSGPEIHAREPDPSALHAGPKSPSWTATSEPLAEPVAVPGPEPTHAATWQEPGAPEEPPAPIVHTGPEPSCWPSQQTNGSSTPRFAMLRAVASRWQHPVPQRRFLVAASSRSEARRLAPVIRTLRSRCAAAGRPDEVCVCASGDNHHTVREAFELLDIAVDCNLSVSTAGQSLDATRARLLNSFESMFSQVKPEWIIVAGDTVMSAMAALAAYYAGIYVARMDVGHAPRATDDLHPEEMYRQIVNLFASVHFTETEWSKETLLHEGVLDTSVLVVGNPGVDALYESCVRLGLPLGPVPSRSTGVTRVLVSVGNQNLPESSAAEIGRAIGNLAVLVPGLYEFTWPLPPDPEASEAVHKLLARVPGIRLTQPTGYEQFLRNLSECDFVLTDSPELQEEAPSLGKPVLMMGSSASNRVEAVRAGVAIHVASDSASIQAAVRSLARKLSSRHGQITNPYGDGKAALRVADFFEGKRVLEFGRSALPRITARNDGPMKLPEPATRWRLES